MSSAQANQLEERLIDFGVKVIVLSGKLPRSYAGQHIANQMFRSGTSPAPNYGEARGGGESRRFCAQDGHRVEGA
jgi:four helix bundle protein